MSYREQKLRIKAQEVIDLLKEYLPEYKETLDKYDSVLDINCYDTDGELDEIDFNFTIGDQNEEYVLDIQNTGIYKVLVSTKELIKVTDYFDEEIAAQCTLENPWTWDDAIAVIKKQMEER